MSSAEEKKLEKDKEKGRTSVELAPLKDRDGSQASTLKTEKSNSIFARKKTGESERGEHAEHEETNFHKKAAKEQANQAKMLRGNKLFAAARSGSVYDFKAIIGKDPKKPDVDVLARGTFGETVLHVACLFANFPVMRYIVENFPQLINLPYEKEPYLGETALHICIVHADVEAVEFLISHGAEVNNCNCTGQFFKPKPPAGKIYIGEHPLTFAACVETGSSDDSEKSDKSKDKSREMIRLLVKAGAHFDNQDDYGNTILHVLVIKDKPEMYLYILDLYDLYSKAIDPDAVKLEFFTNRQLRTPLGLAASLAKGKMFEAIMRRRKETLWVYGPIAECAYPLSEIDTYRDEKPRPPTALELCVYLSGEPGVTEDNVLDRCELLMKMPMKELVDAKWSIFGRKLFYAYFFIYLVYLTIFTFVVARFQFLMEPDGVTGTFSLHALEITVLVFVSIFLLFEVRDIFVLHTWYFTEVGSRTFFAITWLNGLCIWLAFIFRMTGSQDAEEIVTSMASFFSWFFLLYFFRGWKSFGFFAIAIVEIVSNDIVKFFTIYMIISSGFSLLFMVMYRNTNLVGFETLDNSMLSMFHLLTGNNGDFDLSQAHNQLFTTIMQIVYVVLMSILLLNMLIAMMGGTYSNVTDKADKRHVLERVSLILLVERRFVFLFSFLKNKYRSGQPASEIGLGTKDEFYLMLQERTEWGASAATGRRKFVFINAVRKVISAMRMKKVAMSDPKKRQSYILSQKKREEELERLKRKKEEEEAKKKEAMKSHGVEHMFNEFGEMVDEMAFIGYEGDEQIGGAEMN